MKINDFFKDLDKKSLISSLNKYIQKNNIDVTNEECPIIENIVKSRYNDIKHEKINPTQNTLRTYSATK